VRFEKLDLADQSSVDAFAARVAAEGRPLDLLVHNAGVLALPFRKLTIDGFELQWATNYLGHFALAGRLLPLLRKSRQPRVVQLSSMVYRYGRISFDNLQGERSYKPWAAYCQSKLAMLMFSRELQVRSDAHGWGLHSTAVHPGYARTNLLANGPGRRSAIGLLGRSVGLVLSQSAADGAQPALFAATSREAKPAGFYGPGGLLGMAGPPATLFVSKIARDESVARKLWQVSEDSTGVRWSASCACAACKPAAADRA
jgi:NAD(P)-dependent dehydrogenase (short-subunit alcohol dehydrogenase family)